MALLPSFKNTESLTTLIHLKKKAKLNFYKPSCLRTHTPRETWKTINKVIGKNSADNSNSIPIIQKTVPGACSMFLSYDVMI